MHDLQTYVGTWISKIIRKEKYNYSDQQVKNIHLKMKRRIFFNLLNLFLLIYIWEIEKHKLSQNSAFECDYWIYWKLHYDFTAFKMYPQKQLYSGCENVLIDKLF